MTTDLDIERLTITDEDVAQVKQSLEQQIHDAFILSGYRPVNDLEFDADCEFPEYVKYRQANKLPTRIVQGNYTPSQDENLTNYSRKS